MNDDCLSSGYDSSCFMNELSFTRDNNRGCHHLTCLNGEVMIFFPTLLFKINYSKIHVAYVTIKQVRVKCNVKPWDTAK